MKLLGIFYQGWRLGEGEGGHHISDATRENIFPRDTKGCFDTSILYKLLLTRERMQTGDSCFISSDPIYHV